LNSKLHAVTDQDGKPLILLLTHGQMSDHKGANCVGRGTEIGQRMSPSLSGDASAFSVLV
jgi:transposase